MRVFRLFAAVISAVVLGVTLLTAVPASAADSISYTFRFVNGQTISGVANDKTHFLPNAGGTSATNPAGMEVHLSCSDKFVGGWGQKDGPTQGVDTAWQIDSYFIQKGSKTCGTPTPPAPPPDPPAIDIEKFVNGQDADDPTGPEIPIGGTATFSYEVTNTGGIPVRNIEVTDSELGPIGCPRTSLDPGESMSCDEKSEVVTTDGQFTMKATVTGIGDVLTPGVPPSNRDKGHAYRFTFVNGTTIVGESEKNTAFLPNAGGTSATNPTGMDVHVSCSDKFSGGWGEKDGPEQGVDTAWQIASYSIAKLKKGEIDKTCGDPFAIPTEVPVMDMDPVYFIVPPADPKIDIEKFVNGQDADNPPGPTLDDGSTATFTYVVTNTGDVPLDGIMVTDNVVGAISCPRTELGVGESMNCDQTRMMVEVGQHSMESCVKGFNNDRRVDDCDPVYYNVPPPPPDDPKIDIEKFVNGQDADNPPGPTIPAGDFARFVYVVVNNGDVPLDNIAVVDNVIGALNCPRTELGVGEAMVCDPTVMRAEPGDHFMESCVEGFNDGRMVTDCDPVYYNVPPPPGEPKIDIEKFVNGDDADTPPGPTLATGTDARFTYVVTNTGDVPLGNVVATDNVVGALTCPRTELGVGESMDCSPTTMVVEDGQQFMEACVKGSDNGQEVSDCDPVYYMGKKDTPPKPGQIGDMVSFAHGPAAPDVKVDLFKAGPGGTRGAFLGHTRTSGDGIYGFDVEPDCYVVVFIAPTGYEFVGGNRFLQKRTCIDPGEIDLTVDAVLRKA